MRESVRKIEAVLAELTSRRIEQGPSSSNFRISTVQWSLPFYSFFRQRERGTGSCICSVSQQCSIISLL